MTDRCKVCGKVYGKDSRRGLCSTCRKKPAVLAYHVATNLQANRGCWQDDAKSWTKAEEAELTMLFWEGNADSDIAAKLKRPVGSITKKRRRLGLKVSKKRMAASTRRTGVAKRLVKVRAEVERGIANGTRNRERESFSDAEKHKIRTSKLSMKMLAEKYNTTYNAICEVRRGLKKVVD